MDVIRISDMIRSVSVQSREVNVPRGRRAAGGTCVTGDGRDAMIRPVREDNLRRSIGIRLAAAVDRMRSRLWLIPSLLVVGSIVLSVVAVAVDRIIDRTLSTDLSGILFSGGPDSARLILSTIAAAMMTLTGLVFSVTMLVLQLASSQLSPRVTRTFLRDQVNQVVLGLFVATFVYALTVLREVRSPPDGQAFVPALAVTVAFALLLASVAAFVVYINHMTQQIRPITVLRSVADETRAAIERLYPEEIGSEFDTPTPMPSDEPDLLVEADGHGTVTSVDDAKMIQLAIDHRAAVELRPNVGDFVPAGSLLFRVWLGKAPVDDDHEPAAPDAGEAAESREGGASREDLARELRHTVNLGAERTMTQDAAFGFRQLVDVAERALSPGTNDPTTAVQVLDEVHDLLRRLSRRSIPSPARVAEDGSALLYLPRPDWADYVALALDEIRQFGAGSIQVARRLRHLLLDLKAVAPDSRLEPIDRQLRLLDASINAEFSLLDDRRAAGQPSVSGQGPTSADDVASTR